MFHWLTITSLASELRCEDDRLSDLLAICFSFCCNCSLTFAIRSSIVRPEITLFSTDKALEEPELKRAATIVAVNAVIIFQGLCFILIGKNSYHSTFSTFLLVIGRICPFPPLFIVPYNPDWFQFHRTIFHSIREIGNAVIPLLAKPLGTEIIKCLDIDLSTLEIRELDLIDDSILSYNMGQASEFWQVPNDVIATRKKTKVLI